MTQYIQTFVINRTTYGIEQTALGFTVRRSGSAICTEKDIDAARKMLHGYALNQSIAEKGSAQAALDAANETLDKLGNDPFNLGRFLK